MDRTYAVLTSVLQRFVSLLWSHICMILCVDECLFYYGFIKLRFCVTFFITLVCIIVIAILFFNLFFCVLLNRDID